ncbi:transposable element Tcb1 transposase [Trichonephila clavipes]|nr:transposable element Tcb1 transposase [Trichonephila clavipes]
MMEAGWLARRVARQLGRSDCVACPIPRFVSNRAYLRSFGMVSWASHEFERTRGKVTANMERNISRHHAELECLNARSYCIVHQQGIKSSVLLSFCLK